MERLETNTPRHFQHSKAGFSLVELLVVIGVITIIMSLSVASFGRFSKSALLTRTGDNLVGIMAQAQQKAIADNSDIEIRFYQPLNDDDFDPQWSVLLVRENVDGTRRAVSPPYLLPDGIILNRTREVSSLIGGLPEQEDAENLLVNSSAAPLTYTAFRFYSNGSTDLPVSSSGDTWHLTVMDFRDGDGSESKPPPNFFTVRIDPFTGTVRIFRP